ncbi:MAG: arabinose efflux permease family protein [Acidobacteria bacterium]|nr:arabinose efflux permease family protein [Acidobacteriota bacterium]
MPGEGSRYLAERSRTSLVVGSSIAVLYFSEGLPYGIVKEFMPLYLREHGVEVDQIGLLIGIVGYAWTLKFLWSPYVDAAGTYRRWILAAVGVITICFAAIAFAPIGMVLYGLVALVALASATQDIAVDAFTIRATPTHLIGPVNSIRVMAYRVAIMTPGFLALIAKWRGWPVAFAAAACAAALIFAFALRLPHDRGAVSTERPSFILAMKRWLQKPNAATLLAIALIYRLGEFAIVPMIKPYWVDRHYGIAEIGLITSTVGVIVSIAGVTAGGACVARFGLYRSLIWIGILQNASNLGYALVSTFEGGRWSIYTASVVENLGYGAGTAVFISFLMSTADREHAASDYAFITATYGVTGNAITAASGFIIKQAGYAPFFWLTIFLGIPALLLVPRVREQLPS